MITEKDCAVELIGELIAKYFPDNGHLRQDIMQMVINDTSSLPSELLGLVDQTIDTNLRESQFIGS